jgi:hypothetical protein
MCPEYGVTYVSGSTQAFRCEEGEAMKKSRYTEAHVACALRLAEGGTRVDTTAQTSVRDRIIEAYAQYQELAEAATA